jgi:hypothetical protein
VNDLPRYVNDLQRLLVSHFDEQLAQVLGGTKPSTVYVDSTLTTQKLLDSYHALDVLPDPGPPPKVDLWPHDIDDHSMYRVGDGVLSHLPFHDASRQQWFVPRARLLVIKTDLMMQGVDVRIEPRIRPLEPKTEDKA